MKHYLLFSVTAFCAGSVAALAASPKDEIEAAAKGLANQANYSWTATVVVPESAPWRPGPTEGMTEKDGVTCLRMTFGDNVTQAIMKGDKGAVTSPEGDWRSFSELESEEGPGRFWARMLRDYATPAVQVADMAKELTDLKKEGEVYAAALTEDGAKALMMFRRRGAQAEGGPEISGAKGSVKFWLKAGDLVKYEFKVQGTITFNNNDMDVDRTTTVEIKNVGSTKIDVPKAAQEKLS